ncbi:MAG: helix-turn-helix domain-containing protein [Rhizobiaceae bacterium]
MKGGTKITTRHIKVTASGCISEENGTWLENEFSGPCTVRGILDRIGDKWSVLVVLRLGAHPQRFRALLRAVDVISARMLTVTLRGLERDGFVNREVYDTRPPSVEYSLTPLGRTLLGHVSVLASWVVDSEMTIKKAQTKFDALNK